MLPSETSIYFTSVKNFIILWLHLMFSVCYVMLMLFNFFFFFFLLVSFKIIHSYSFIYLFVVVFFFFFFRRLVSWTV